MRRWVGVGLVVFGIAVTDLQDLGLVLQWVDRDARSTLFRRGDREREPARAGNRRFAATDETSGGLDRLPAVALGFDLESEERHFE